MAAVLINSSSSASEIGPLTSQNWSLLGLEGVDQLPSIQWQLANLAKIKPKKHAGYLEKLKQVLGVVQSGSHF